MRRVCRHEAEAHQAAVRRVPACHPTNYTCSNLADHLDPKVSHDAVGDFLRRERFTAGHLWELARSLICDSKDAYLILDDSVQDKRHSRKVELARRQWSGAEGGLVRGIGVVNLLHSDGSDFYPIDFRIYAPEHDKKTKHEHARAMLRRAFEDKRYRPARCSSTRGTPRPRRSR